MKKIKLPKINLKNDDCDDCDDCDDNLNNINFDDGEDEVRHPIPSHINCLNGDDDCDEEFKQFKKDILSDKFIDNDMKQIIIQSRIEFIHNHQNKLQENAEKTIRINLIVPLKIKLKDNNYTKISIGDKEKIMILIDKWIDNRNHLLIKIESDSLYQLYELIDLMGDENKIHDIQKIKKIFTPKNPDEFIELIEIMNVIKIQSILEENKRIQKELELKKIEEENAIKLKELEKNKLQEIEIRREGVKLLLFNLNKMSTFDSKIKILKEILEEPIRKYCSLESKQILLGNEIYNDTIKFINSIRINSQDKEFINGLCKCL